MREVSQNMRRNVLMTLASISTVMVLVVMLGFFIVLVANLRAFTGGLTAQLEILVRLNDPIGSDQIQKLQLVLIDMPEVKGVEFVPKERAFRDLQQQLAGQISITDMGGNPLPNYFEVRARHSSDIPLLADRIKQLPGVKLVKYGGEVADKIITLDRIIHWIGFFVLALLGASTVLIISNTIRLTVFARRDEIRVMQLVGAANWFIRWPFIIEGVIQGLLGAALAVLLLKAAFDPILSGVLTHSSFLNLPAPGIILAEITPILLGVGILMGALGSLISINRFLRTN